MKLCSAAAVFDTDVTSDRIVCVCVQQRKGEGNFLSPSSSYGKTYGGTGKVCMYSLDTRLNFLSW